MPACDRPCAAPCQAGPSSWRRQPSLAGRAQGPSNPSHVQTRPESHCETQASSDLARHQCRTVPYALRALSGHAPPPCPMHTPREAPLAQRARLKANLKDAAPTAACLPINPTCPTPVHVRHKAHAHARGWLPRGSPPGLPGAPACRRADGPPVGPGRRCTHRPRAGQQRRKREEMGVNIPKKRALVCAHAAPLLARSQGPLTPQEPQQWPPAARRKPGHHCSCIARTPPQHALADSRRTAPLDQITLGGEAAHT